MIVILLYLSASAVVCGYKPYPAFAGIELKLFAVCSRKLKNAVFGCPCEIGNGSGACKLARSACEIIIAVGFRFACSLVIRFVYIFGIGIQRNNVCKAYFLFEIGLVSVSFVLAVICKGVAVCA